MRIQFMVGLGLGGKEMDIFRLNALSQTVSYVELDFECVYLFKTPTITPFSAWMKLNDYIGWCTSMPI